MEDDELEDTGNPVLVPEPEPESESDGEGDADPQSRITRSSTGRVTHVDGVEVSTSYSHGGRNSVGYELADGRTIEFQKVTPGSDELIEESGWEPGTPRVAADSGHKRLMHDVNNEPYWVEPDPEHWDEATGTGGWRRTDSPGHEDDPASVLTPDGPRTLRAGDRATRQQGAENPVRVELPAEVVEDYLGGFTEQEAAPVREQLRDVTGALTQERYDEEAAELAALTRTTEDTRAGREFREWLEEAGVPAEERAGLTQQYLDNYRGDDSEGLWADITEQAGAVDGVFYRIDGQIVGKDEYDAAVWERDSTYTLVDTYTQADGTPMAQYRVERPDGTVETHYLDASNVSGAAPADIAWEGRLTAEVGREVFGDNFTEDLVGGYYSGIDDDGNVQLIYDRPETPYWLGQLTAADSEKFFGSAKYAGLQYAGTTEEVQPDGTVKYITNFRGQDQREIVRAVTDKWGRHIVFYRVPADGDGGYTLIQEEITLPEGSTNLRVEDGAVTYTPPPAEAVRAVTDKWGRHLVFYRETGADGETRLRPVEVELPDTATNVRLDGGEIVYDLPEESYRLVSAHTDPESGLRMGIFRSDSGRLMTQPIPDTELHAVSREMVDGQPVYSAEHRVTTPEGEVSYDTQALDLPPDAYNVRVEDGQVWYDLPPAPGAMGDRIIGAQTVAQEQYDAWVASQGGLGGDVAANAELRSIGIAGGGDYMADAVVAGETTAAERAAADYQAWQTAVAAADDDAAGEYNRQAEVRTANRLFAEGLDAAAARDAAMGGSPDTLYTSRLNNEGYALTNAGLLVPIESDYSQLSRYYVIPRGGEVFDTPGASAWTPELAAYNPVGGDLAFTTPGEPIYPASEGGQLREHPGLLTMALSGDFAAPSAPQVITGPQDQAWLQYAYNMGLPPGEAEAAVRQVWEAAHGSDTPAHTPGLAYQQRNAELVGQGVSIGTGALTAATIPWTLGGSAGLAASINVGGRWIAGRLITQAGRHYLRTQAGRLIPVAGQALRLAPRQAANVAVQTVRHPVATTRIAAPVVGRGLWNPYTRAVYAEGAGETVFDVGIGYTVAKATGQNYDWLPEIRQSAVQGLTEGVYELPLGALRGSNVVRDSAFSSALAEATWQPVYGGDASDIYVAFGSGAATGPITHRLFDRSGRLIGRVRARGRGASGSGEGRGEGGAGAGAGAGAGGGGSPAPGSVGTAAPAAAAPPSPAPTAPPPVAVTHRIQPDPDAGLSPAMSRSGSPSGDASLSGSVAPDASLSPSPRVAAQISAPVSPAAAAAPTQAAAAAPTQAAAASPSAAASPAASVSPAATASPAASVAASPSISPAVSPSVAVSVSPSVTPSGSAAGAFGASPSGSPDGRPGPSSPAPGLTPGSAPAPAHGAPAGLGVDVSPSVGTSAGAGVGDATSAATSAAASKSAATSAAVSPAASPSLSNPDLILPSGGGGDAKGRQQGRYPKAVRHKATAEIHTDLDTGQQTAVLDGNLRDARVVEYGDRPAKQRKVEGRNADFTLEGGNRKVRVSPRRNSGPHRVNRTRPAAAAPFSAPASRAGRGKGGRSAASSAAENMARGRRNRQIR